MALQKETTTDSAVSANYYKIDELRGTVSSGDLIVKVGLYKSKADRDSGATPISSRKYSVPVDYSSASNLMGQAYTALKLEDAFSGATDV